VKVTAFIPARGGSKRVPWKNLCEVGGLSLLARTISAADQSGCRVVVSSDDAGIRCHAREEGADELHDRPPQLASDHAQIESALSHWWVRLDEKPDVIVLLQPTSPFRTSHHIREAVGLLKRGVCDSVVGVTAGHGPHFAGRLKPREPEDMACPCFDCATDDRWFDFQPFRDLDAMARPRTQDMRPMGTENGSLYAFTREHWEKTGNRMGGRMAAVRMSWIEGLDIDDERDLAAARAIAEGMGL